MSQAGTVTRFPGRALAVTPNDTIKIVPSTIFVGGAGVVTCHPVDNDAGSNVAITIPAGGVIPFLVDLVLATGTTATLMVAVA